VIHTDQKRVIRQGTDLGIISGVTGDREEILYTAVYPQRTQVEAAQKLRRQAVPEGYILESEVASVFNKSIGNTLVVIGIRRGDSRNRGFRVGDKDIVDVEQQAASGAPGQTTKESAPGTKTTTTLGPLPARRSEAVTLALLGTGLVLMLGGSFYGRIKSINLPGGVALTLADIQTGGSELEKLDAIRRLTRKT
jgi:hypothetical protein